MAIILFVLLKFEFILGFFAKGYMIVIFYTQNIIFSCDDINQLILYPMIGAFTDACCFARLILCVRLDRKVILRNNILLKLPICLNLFMINFDVFDLRSISLKRIFGKKKASVIKFLIWCLFEAIYRWFLIVMDALEPNWI